MDWDNIDRTRHDKAVAWIDRILSNENNEQFEMEEALTQAGMLTEVELDVRRETLAARLKLSKRVLGSEARKRRKAREKSEAKSSDDGDGGDRSRAKLDLDLSDSGNAERLALRHGDKLRFCHEMKNWLWWDGRRWKLDEGQKARVLMEETMRQFVADIVKRGNETQIKFASSCLDSWRLTNGLREAEKKLGINADRLDSHPFLLNFKNGTMNLETDKLLPHNPEQYLTKIIHWDYDPAAKCPKFDAFVQKAVGADAVPFLQKLIGYALTGDVSEKVFVAVLGETDCGKTTFLELIYELIEEYRVQVQIETLLQKQGTDSSVQEDLAALRGVRFAKTSEVDKNRKLSVSLVKRINQGSYGKITCARKYEHRISFCESHKLFFDTNHMPTIPPDEEAIWNRLIIVYFGTQIPKAEQNKNLVKELLKEEAPGILAWAVRGELQRRTDRGLGLVPKAFEDEKAKWRDRMNEIKQFIADVCLVEKGAKVKQTEVYKAFVSWHGADRHPLSKRVFTSRLSAEGFKPDASRVNYCGFKLSAVAETEPLTEAEQLKLVSTDNSEDFDDLAF